MPWQEVPVVSQREHFYNLWQSGYPKVTALCRLFGISRKTGYKWIKRGNETQANPFEDQSRKPKTSPIKTSPGIEKTVIALRKQYPDWGGRKLKKLMQKHGEKIIPCASTITEILRRHGLLEPKANEATAPLRFEHAYANSLWQMDFKGHFAMSRSRCHPLTVLDDHSRFNLVLKACAEETRVLVESALIEAFERYGLPDRMTMDNGSPWGNKYAGRYTKLTVWLMDCGIRVSHSRPYHPQTQGKDERFHRTLKTEVLSRQHFCNLTQCQKAFDQWSVVYNYVRPHEALKLEVPASRYQVSPRRYQGWDMPFDYSDEDIVRKVNSAGTISYQSQKRFLGEAFAGRWVAVKRTIQPQHFEVYYRHQCIGNMKIET